MVACTRVHGAWYMAPESEHMFMFGELCPGTTLSKAVATQQPRQEPQPLDVKERTIVSDVETEPIHATGLVSHHNLGRTTALATESLEVRADAEHCSG